MKTIWIVLSITSSFMSATAQAKVSCTPGSFSGGGLDFGSHPLKQAHIDASTTFSMSCTNNGIAPQKIRICPNLSAIPGANVSDARLMKTPNGDTLKYQLYTTQARTEQIAQWPSDNGSMLVDFPPNSTRQISIALYGRIFDGQATHPIGFYSSRFDGQQNIIFRWAEVSDGQNCAALPHQNLSVTDFEVRFYAKPHCELAIATHIDFGSVSSLNLSADIDATGSFSVTCSSGTSYTIGMTNGLHAQENQRHMRHTRQSDQYIKYEIYQGGYITRWGKDPAQVFSGKGDGSVQSYVIYAKVPGGQPPVLAGVYEDNVIVTLHH